MQFAKTFVACVVLSVLAAGVTDAAPFPRTEVALAERANQFALGTNGVLSEPLRIEGLPRNPEMTASVAQWHQTLMAEGIVTAEGSK